MSWLLSWLLFRPLFYLVLYGIPLIGLWVASSLAAYMGGPHWIPWTVGLLMFPVLPGLWELRAHAHRSPKKKPWFTLVDRLSMRTFVIGLLFMGGMLYLYPQLAFVSLSTRGDWMLDDVKDPRFTRIRPYLFQAAGGLEWLYQATKTNPYKTSVDPQARQRAEEAAKQLQQENAAQQEKENSEQSNQPVLQTNSSAAQSGTGVDGIGESNSNSSSTARPASGQLSQSRDLQQNTISSHLANYVGNNADVAVQSAEKMHNKSDSNGDGQSKDGQAIKEAKEQVESSTNSGRTPSAKENAPSASGDSAAKWPWIGATLHPVVLQMPKSAEKSFESVARYIADREPDPVLRIKALHDYVVDRVAYDSDSYYANKIPDQDAERVFRTRKSVCSGYANLLSAMAAAIGDEIIVVTGDARTRTQNKLSGEGHAWNAAKIRGRWYLMDACWDAGYVSREEGFTKRYRTDYLLAPAEVMIQDHYPDDKNWQLLAHPLSQGDFLRQPMLKPGFHAADLKLVAPQRALVEAGPEGTVIVRNPDHYWLMAGLEQDGKTLPLSTTPTNDDTTQLVCALPGKGTYRVNVFLNKTADRYASYQFVGCFDFVNR